MDSVLEYLEKAARSAPAIERMRLFGSRARGDHHSRSDYDVAVDAPRWSHHEWARWSERMKTEVPTLAGLDLVRVDTGTDPGLLRAIESEGKVIFERGEP